MASNPQFFLSVFILCFFLFCVFCVSFSSFFVLLLPLLLLLLLLLLPLQCINGYIRVKLGQKPKRCKKFPHFFCQFSSSASFSSVYFMYLFLLLLLLLLVLLRLLLLLLLLLLPLLLNDQIANLFGAFTLFQGKQLCFFLCCKKFLIRPPYSAASYMN